jgi:hypothetical protein
VMGAGLVGDSQALSGGVWLVRPPAPSHQESAGYTDCADSHLRHLRNLRVWLAQPPAPSQ